MIEQEALSIAQQRGWEIEQLDPMLKLMSKTYAKTNLMFGNTDSRIAAMMINGNTKGVVKGIKNRHHGNRSDLKIDKLGEKLLSFENANIQQMQEYL